MNDRIIDQKETESFNYRGKCYDDKKTYLVVANFTHIVNKKINTMKKYLNWEELEYLKTIKNRKRLESYLFGRFSLKKAASHYCMQRSMNDFTIRNGILGQPIIEKKDASNISGSISHCDTCAASIVFDDDLVLGIDIEENNRNIKKILMNYITTSEIKAMSQLSHAEVVNYLILWTAKESLSKCLKTGLTIPFELFEVKTIKEFEEYNKITYTNFSQYATNIYVLKHYVCSITYPKSLHLVLNRFTNEL